MSKSPSRSDSPSLTTLKRLRWRVELGLRNGPLFGVRHRRKRLFFPGCSLPSSDPEITHTVLDHLRRQDPEIGLWSACCGRPLHQFVGPGAAAPVQSALLEAIDRDGIEEILVACGNCNDELTTLTQSRPGVRVTNLYDVLAQERWDVGAVGPLTVHHPCPARQQPAQSEAFHRLADAAGLELVNPTKSKHALACCLVKTPSADRKREKLTSAGAEVVTYCAHCTRSFQPDVPTRHVLQVLFGSTRRWRPISLLTQFWNYLRLAWRARSGAAPSPVPVPVRSR